MKILSRDFIPVSGNTHELQNGSSRSQKWMYKVLETMNEPGLTKQIESGGSTIQGFYILGADGSSYGWINVHYAPSVREFLKKGLDRFNKHPPGNVTITKDLLKDKFSPRPKKSTSVVRVFTRISPVPYGSNEINKSIGRDHLWIYQKELKEINSHKNRGERFDMPEALAGRIARFNLVDNVRGEPDMWEVGEIKKAKFRMKLIESIGDLKKYRISGKFASGTANGSRGIEGSLTGNLEIDSNSIELRKFRLFADSVAWGRSRFTPHPPPGRFKLVTAMMEVDDEIAQLVPPQGLLWQNGYTNARLAGSAK